MFNRLAIIIACLFFSQQLAAQQFDYDAHWGKVNEYYEKSLPKSALKELEVIYARALKDDSEVNWLKALLLQARMHSDIDRENVDSYLALINQSIPLAKPSAKAILYSMKGEILWVFLQQHQYKIQSRTKLDIDTARDIKSWGPDRLHEEISKAYHASLADPRMLQQRDIKHYDDILLRENNTQVMQPTLYDLLSTRALSYYSSGGNSGYNAASRFYISDKMAYAPVAGFIKHTFTNPDTLSTLRYEALQLHQQVLAFKLASGSREAMLHADLARIDFVKANDAIQYESDQTPYQQTLERMLKEYEGLPEQGEVYYRLAQHIYSTAGAADRKEKLEQVLAYCRKAMEQYPGTQGAVNSERLLIEITNPTISFIINKVNIPGKPFLALVNYKNVSAVHFRVVQLDSAFYKLWKLGVYGNKGIWKLLSGKPALKSWIQPVPNPGDYNNHTAEVKIDALPNGHYLLLASDAATFEVDSNSVALQELGISSLSYFHNQNKLFVVDRENGKPIGKARVFFATSKQTRYTDAVGMVQLPVINRWEQSLEISKGDDTLYADGLYGNSPQGALKEKSVKILFFTDRSIYRPGQTVYFKGIVTDHDSEKAGPDKLKVGYTSRLALLDSNGDEVDTIEVKTNEYGSYAGSFKIPTGLLNGTFEIEDEEEGEVHSIKVEEYKRPKFSIAFDTVRANYRAGDTIRVKGTATALSGSVIDGAHVEYKVALSTSYYTPYNRRGIIPGVREENLVTKGETSTDSAGNFYFSFITDTITLTNGRELQNYLSSVAVTDRNGETREEDLSVNVARKSIVTSLSVGVDKKRDSVGIWSTTENYAGYRIATPVTLRITRLQPPAVAKRSRIWQVPDQFVMQQEEFERYFPNDHYKAEGSSENWPRAEEVWNKKYDSIAPYMKLNAKHWKDGLYLFELAGIDARGDSVYSKTAKLVEDESKPSLTIPAYLWQPDAYVTGKPGETVYTSIGSAAKDVNILQIITRNYKHTFSWKSLSAERKRYGVELRKEDDKGLDVEYVFVKDNRLYTSRQHIPVLPENTQLKLQFATFRNKLEPGDQQTWQISIKDEKKQKVQAEMLAAMYDASLDQLYSHQWNTPAFYSNHYSYYSNWTNEAFSSGYSTNWYKVQRRQTLTKSFENVQLNWFGWSYRGIADGHIMIRGMASAPVADSQGLNEVVVVGYGVQKRASVTGAVSSVAIYGSRAADALDIALEGRVAGVAVAPAPPPAPASKAAPTVRKNLQETAFFLPQLRTDAKGGITFSFTSPEALTKWRFMAMAHTRNMQSGYLETSVVTQKTLMVQPNAPRFFREGDKIDLTVKISSLADKELIGQARLELLNAATMQPVDGWFQNVFPTQHFTVKARQSTAVSFPLQIPFGYNEALVYRVVAEAGDFSDGEENALPVLSNRMLVTETMPLPVQGSEPVTFNMEKLLQSDTTEGLQQHALTVEFTGNPVWNAIKSLPYLMEYPYECAEQNFNRFYANAIGSHLVNSAPRVKAIFDQWQADTSAMVSKLELNEELKSALLQETPWVLEAKNEAEQHRRLALLFDLSLMERSMDALKLKLRSVQNSDGSFSWFKDMPGNYYITQYIASGFGHLRQLGITLVEKDEEVKVMMHDAINYLDLQILNRYKEDLKNKTSSYYSMVYHLYMRSFYKDWVIPAVSKPAYDHYFKQVKENWRKYSTYSKGLAALALYREGDEKTAQAILASVKEHAVETPGQGAYWKEDWGYYWYQAPVETQALMIEAFSTVTKDSKFVTALKTWLLKNKQTNSWNTTKATAEACFALLLGNDWLSEEQQVQIKLGKQVIDSREQKREAGTGYFKKRYEGKEVTADMGKVTIQLQNSTGQPAWGGLYWQYFQDMDKITPSATPLTLEKELYIQRTGSKGTELTKITEGNPLKVGDKVTVRIIMKVQKEMEYLHLKDMRAACFEPVNVLSGYRWRDGAGYYESTKDASTNFFFAEVRPGTYVFEYPVFVTHTGTYSNGISSVQSMYAPEFSAHSAGIKVKVTE
ncbi:alpha-2-macroglobulin family protein [uncultured Chitinophaga sp.]|uniref:alpha-2-macroglobulin family protein n=1 Tax=uncultured Chitinophaga sp. TaxID=339340 RepID=UPI0025FF6DA3|nr:alpha-2-macroglobulin family protein [uncultured Chitinophaga sp.]